MAAPFVLPAKLLLQDLSRKGLGWDDEILCLHLSRWQAWLADLPKLSQLSVKRCVKGVNLGEGVTTEIHHFCDASQCAYGAISYLRQVDSDGQAHCSFLVGKSCLAPLKQMSIPRLELAAATVSVRLNRLLKNEQEIPIYKITFWTDSVTVLRYIANECKRFHTYVTNRVAIIREDSSPSRWSYIEPKSNPADDASRGISADAFIQNGRWIKGPDFLLKPPSEWINLPKHSTELSGDDPEVKQESKSFAVDVRPNEVQSNIISLVQQFSSWLKLLKFIAVCLQCQRRFITRKRKSKQDGFDRSSQAASLEPFTCSEINDAEREVIMLDQSCVFAEERRVLKSSVLAKLDPILVNGLLRVSGCLSRAPLHDDSKHQIIIAKDSPVARLLIQHFHQKSDHSGREYVLSLLKERFWLIRANVTVRSVLASCFDCRWRQGTVGEQKTADLPCPRVTPDQPPFTCVGKVINYYYYYY